MILQSLTVGQYRGFASTTAFDFHPRFTVIVGENGVGKSSVIWALRVLLSHLIAEVVGRSAKKLSFQPDDIARGWPYLQAEVAIVRDTGGAPLIYAAQKNAATFIPRAGNDGRPREHAVDTPDRYDYRGGSSSPPPMRRVRSAPLAVYYSAHRSVVGSRGPSAARAAGGIGVAHAEALEDRELRLGEAAMLWRKEAALEKTDHLPARANRAIEQAIPTFLGEFRNLRSEGDDRPTLVVEKHGMSLNLSQLSDGEKGLLAVLMDLTRRLTQANPSLQNPALDGQAIVLIDELDLHMHPRWQRQIVSRLTATFPNCQFIVTTHSPQIIGEAQPENLLLLRQEGDRILSEQCGQAFGLDANYVLEHIMGTAPRAEAATVAIHAVEEALEVGDLEAARVRLDAVRALIHGDDLMVVGLEATINNLEALGNETDPQEE